MVCSSLHLVQDSHRCNKEIKTGIVKCVYGWSVFEFHVFLPNNLLVVCGVRTASRLIAPSEENVLRRMNDELCKFETTFGEWPVIDDDISAL